MADTFYRHLLDNLFDAVYFVDRERRITYWNHAAERFTGYQRNEIMGMRCMDNVLVHVNDAGEQLCTSACPLAATMLDGEIRQANVFFRHKDGHRVPCSVRVSPIRDEQGEIIGGVEIFSDNSASVAALARISELEKAAYLDPLTGIANRRYIDAFMAGKFAEMARLHWPFGVIFADIDHFKPINDRFGHNVGDRVLAMVASTLKSNIRAFDLVGRWGGDEFLVVVSAGMPDLRRLAYRLRLLVAHSEVAERERPIRVTISVGVTQALPTDDESTLIKRADDLMYHGKSASHNRAAPNPGI